MAAHSGRPLLILHAFLEGIPEPEGQGIADVFVTGQVGQVEADAHVFDTGAQGYERRQDAQFGAIVVTGPYEYEVVITILQAGGDAQGA